jgi:hypothetical protein
MTPTISDGRDEYERRHGTATTTTTGDDVFTQETLAAGNLQFVGRARYAAAHGNTQAREALTAWDATHRGDAA